MRPRKPKSKCAICQETGDGFHFGAEACKACAAFFRRTVQLKLTYRCRGNQDCDVSSNIRCMCRYCRFSKCLQVGMNPMGVQMKPLIPDTPSSTSVPSSFSSSSSTPSTPRSSILLLELPQSYCTSVPLLMKMRENYKKLSNAREVVHNESDRNLFEARRPRAMTYKEATEQGTKDLSLTADWVSGCFEDFVGLSMDQKNILFRNFYTPFFMTEGAFYSHLTNRPDVVVLPTGNFIDVNNLEYFYTDVTINKTMTKDQFYSFIKCSYDLHRKSLILPMIAQNLDIFEFFALITFLLWDTTLEDVTEECSRIGKRVKDQVMTELSFYMRNFKKIEDPVPRVGAILNLLPAVYKSTRKVQDDLEMTQVFNLYNASKEFYDIINGNFC